MPRIARVVCSDTPYHVTQRGNYRQDIFEEEADREKYMEFFMMYKEKYKVNRDVYQFSCGCVYTVLLKFNTSQDLSI